MGYREVEPQNSIEDWKSSPSLPLFSAGAAHATRPSAITSAMITAISFFIVFLHFFRYVLLSITQLINDNIPSVLNQIHYTDYAEKTALIFAISIINASYLCHLNIFAKDLSSILLTSIIFKFTILTIKENKHQRKELLTAASFILPA